jgi:tetratricopeptide (TPR) repeat protein
MTSKLSRLCEGIIEAGWLAALIIVPLFFNVHSSRVFEPDKLSILRSIALVMILAWLVKLLNDGWGGSSPGQDDQAADPPGLWQRIRTTPLVLPTLILAAAYLISTVLSLSPRISWWGSYQRLQGTYTTLSYIVIFFLALGHLRRPDQWRRLTYAIILTSLPIGIYAVLQRTGLDPLPWGGDVQRRVASNMGNAIFVAAYMLMALYLTLYRLLIHFGRLLREEETRRGLADAVLAGCYLFILVVQLITILFTQSRGPFLGLVAGLYIFSLVGLLGLRAWSQRQENLGPITRFVARWGWLGTMIAAVAMVAFLVTFNLPNSPLAPLRANPYIGRLGTALDFEANTARVRTLIWEGVTGLMPPHEPLEYPATGGESDVTVLTPDRVNAIRPLVGYGPEAMWVAFNRFYPPDLAHHESRNASPDRSHNETFDALVITGALGFAAYMFLFLSVFYYALKWLGLMGSRGQRYLFLVLAALGGAAGAIIPYLVMGNWILLGIGLPAGLILGIILYITLAAILNERREQAMELGGRELIILAVLATVVAHFVEIHFGIAIAATRTYFWVLSAVLVVVGMRWLSLATPATETAAQARVDPAPAATKAPRRSRRGRRRRRDPSAPAPKPAPARPTATGQWDEVLVYALVMGIILFTLAYNYTVNPNILELRETNPFAVFWNAFTSRVVDGQRVASLGLLWLVLFTWMVGTAVAVFGIARSRLTAVSGGWLGRAALIQAGVSLGIFLLFGLLHAANIARDAREQRPGNPITLDQISDMAASHIVTYYLLAFALILALGIAIWRTRLGRGAWLGRGQWLGPVVGVGLGLVALLFILNVNISLVRADIIYKQGQAYDSARRYDESVFLYEKAIDEQPAEDYYHLFLGRAQLERARQASGQERDQLIREAEESLLRAQELNPLNTDHTANLGRLYLTWAQLAPSEERSELIQRSLDYYAVATSLSPNAAHLYNEYGSAHELAGDSDKALERYRYSLSLDQEYADTYRRLGDLYQRRDQPDQAIETYEQGLAIAPNDIHLHSNLGFLYAQRGEADKAIEHNLAVLDRRPNDLPSARNLAILYQEIGDLERALNYAQRALEMAEEPNDRTALEQLVQQLQGLLEG